MRARDEPFFDVEKMTESVEPAPKMNAGFFRSLCYGNQAAKRLELQHGFEDDTHNACCLLGPKSRNGADATGNPIGAAAARVAAASENVAADAMTPWSTCMGSAVCSSYGQTYGDAYMKFAVSPDKKLIYLPAHGTRLRPECEHFLQEEIFRGDRHATPGISLNNEACSPEEQKQIRRDVILVPT